MSKHSRVHRAGPRPALLLGFMLTTLCGHAGRAEPGSAGAVDWLPMQSAPMALQQANHPAAPGGVAAGRTAGRFSVGPAGGAHYRVALWVPPGVGRIAPQLGLSYDSRGGNGLLGVGWSLDGLSAITRCNRSWDPDGAPAPVTNTLADRYCLDGQPLKLTSAPGSNGQPGSTYATEIESFARVSANGVAGAGPASFTVATRDGLVYEYGAAPDSRVHAGASTTVRTWAVSRIRDRAGGPTAGNAIVLRYHNDGAAGAYTHGSLRLAAIDYPYTASGAGPFYTVEFGYGAHAPAAVPGGYLAGHAVREPHRLERVEVRETTGALLRSTYLTYELSPVTGLSRLATLQECSSTHCLSPTRIGYREGERGWQPQNLLPSTLKSNATEVAPFTADFNGDGLGDLFYPVKSGTGKSRWWVAFATPNGFATALDTGVTTVNYAPVLVGRFEGGHASQLLLAPGGSSGWMLLRWNAGRFEIAPTGILGASEFLALDYDGDGLDDLASVTGRSITLRRNLTTPPGAVRFAATKEQIWQGEEGSGPRGGAGNTTLTSVADFDADGRADLAVHAAVTTPIGFGYRWHVLRSRGFGQAALATQIDSSFHAGDTSLAGDWNGDGCSDLLGTRAVLVSDCAGGFAAIPIVQPASTAERVAADWDGDGRVDLLHLDSEQRLWSVQRSTGEGVEPPQPLSFAVGNKSQWFVGDVDGDGLTDLGLRDASDSNRLKVFRHLGVAPDLATSFTDGYGQSAVVSYLPITRGAYSSGGTAPEFPYADYLGPLSVVERYTANTGAGGTYEIRFAYAGARMHLQGRGFAGFASRRSTDSRTGLILAEDYAQVYPHTSMPTRLRRLRPDGTTLLEDSQATLAASAFGTGSERREFPYVAESARIDYEYGGVLDGEPVTEQRVTAAYDAWGSPTRLVATTTDRDRESPFFGESWTASSEFGWQHDPGANWCLGLPLSGTLTRTAPGQAAHTRRTSFESDALACRLTRIVSEPEQAALRVTRTVGYDLCGNPASLGVQGSTPAGQPMPLRSTQLDHGARCQLPVAVTNARGETTRIEPDYAHGYPRRLTDANGLATDWQYDAFGRVLLERRPDGTATSFEYASCPAGSNCWGGGLRERVVTQQLDTGGAVFHSSEQYFDGWGQWRQQQSQRAHGLWAVDQRVERDSLGRPIRMFRPYELASQGQVQLDYDLRDRVVQARLHDAGGASLRQLEWRRAGRSTEIVDPLQRSRRFIHDPAGLLRRVVDPAPGGTTAYDYSADGRLLRIVDPGGSTSTAEYDANGHRTRWNDQDGGDWRFSVNSLGEPLAWTDGNGKSFSATYDLLGRLTSRTDPDGSSSFDWGNSAAARNLGRLVRASGHGLTETRAYDAAGRLASRSVDTDQAYVFDYGYNSFGLLDTLSYPQSPVPSGQTGTRLRVQYDYSHGHPVEVRDVSEAQPRTLWTLVQSAADRRPTLERLGGSLLTLRTDYAPATGELLALRAGVAADGDRQNLAYEWNAAGELASRENRASGRRETFEHDALGRLQRARLDGVETLSLSYDAAGNLRARSGATFQYGDASRPNRLTSAGSRSYAYDGNGNVRDIGGVAQYWTSYGLPSNLRINGRQGRYYYGPSRELWRQIASYANGTETTWYAAGLLERIQATATGSTQFWRHYVPTPGGQAIVVSRSSNGGGATSYQLGDHLGSGDVLLDEAGGLRLQTSFDALGARRGADWSAATAPDLAGVANATRRGYTGHDALDNLGLVHMGGRVYDPAIGRFLSTDPLIGDPADSQSLNPYAYVGNRPLEYVDPSGLDAVDSRHRWLNRAVNSLANFAFMHGQHFAVGPPRYLTPHSPPGAVPGLSAQSGVAPCEAGTGSPACSGIDVDFPMAGAGLMPLEMQMYVLAASASGAEVREALGAFVEWWNAPVTIVFAGRMAAVAWDGNPDSWMAPRANTASPGERILNTASAVSMVLPPTGAATAGAAAASRGGAALQKVLASSAPAAQGAVKSIPSAGGVIRKFEQSVDQVYYRVFSDSAAGRWLTAVPPRSGAWAREALALPPGNSATFIQEVRVPAGTLMERSRALPVPQWNRMRGGAEQFELLEEIPLRSFDSGVPLP